uniref:Ribosomal RNA assembly protein (KRR1) n=1 Tax=uncultured marine group II/III euryarchaeote KM3_139_C07 TaxID=1457870 RepID=A0A075G9S1_9EURY|nr:ribosomal RNA assembly protein (KRR1) [uncultured marine group II/III euryarchaeote KM3_139_C07]
MAQYSNEIRIPKERVAILIGKKGEIKKELEDLTKTKIIVDSKEGDIFLSGNDALSLFDVVEVIKAIGRGFNPDIAFLVLKQDYVFELINMNDFAKTKNDSVRLKGRVIGSEGKSRNTIEELTETNISVYGKTIGIIGLQENVASARKAIESLLSGSPHSNVFRFLEKNRRVMKSKELLGKDIKE